MRLGNIQQNQKLSIALIEDDDMDYHWIGGMLKRIPDVDCKFSWAKSYTEGADLLHEQQFDIAFIDHSIGVKSGLDIVRKFGGRDARTPMIMLTGAGSRLIDSEALDAGVYDFLEKGTTSTDELERSIRYTLKTRKLETDLRNARDAAETANKSKSNFLSHLSHDLKTPLNAIVGFAELITLSKNTPQNTKEYAEQIYSSGRHLTDMIEDLLTLTYFDTQKAECTPRQYPIAELLDEAITQTHYIAKERNIEIKPLCATEDVSIFADKKAIRRILVNLITVSIKHSGQSGNIYIACAEDTQGVSILVSDDGSGIAETTITEVINSGPYSSDAYTTTSNGVGISLSIVHRYVLMHNGKMLVESKENGGTIVKLFFPHNHGA